MKSVINAVSLRSYGLYGNAWIELLMINAEPLYDLTSSEGRVLSATSLSDQFETKRDFGSLCSLSTQASWKPLYFFVFP